MKGKSKTQEMEDALKTVTDKLKSVTESCEQTKDCSTSIKGMKQQAAALLTKIGKAEATEEAASTGGSPAGGLGLDLKDIVNMRVAQEKSKKD